MKNLSVDLMQIIGDVEKRSTFRVRLNGEKQAYWDEALRAINEYKENNGGN